MKKSILFIILLVLFSSFTIAVPPVTQTFVGEVGLEIIIPQAEFLKQYRTVKMHTHVYNASSGFAMFNDTTSCLVHIYNSTGAHVLEEQMGFDSNSLEWKLDIGGGNFSKLDKCSFIIQCNTSTVGGFVSGSFTVTKDGTEPETDLSRNLKNLWIFSFYIVLLLCFTLMIVFEKFKKCKNKENKIQKAKNIHFYQVLLILEFILFTTTIYMLYLEQEIEALLYLQFILIFIMGLVYVLIKLFKIFVTGIEIDEFDENENYNDEQKTKQNNYKKWQKEDKSKSG